MIEQIVQTNGVEGAAPLHSPRFLEVQGALQLRRTIEQRILELEEADRETVQQLARIRTVLAEFRQVLEKAGDVVPLSPPTPNEERAS